VATHFPTVPLDVIAQNRHFPGQDRTRPVAMVVDDDPVISGTLAAILNGSGLAVITASDGRQALETAQVIPPEILISDLRLPDIDGFNLALQLTRAVSDCAVILLCGPEQDFEFIGRLESLGIPICILAKPVHPADLLRGVLDLLTRSGSRLGAPKKMRTPPDTSLRSAATRRRA
jgi:DNA-binding response OmpR family regulator